MSTTVLPIHIVSLFNEMAQRIKNWDNVGTLRIGASITIGTHILPGLIKEYQKDFPYLRIKVTVNKSATIEQHILDNKIDIGLIENQPDHPEILSQPFMKDNLCAIVPNEDPLSSKAYITLEELASRPFLMREKRKCRERNSGRLLFFKKYSCKPFMGKFQYSGYCKRSFYESWCCCSSLSFN